MAATITNFLAQPISNLTSTSKITPIFPQFPANFHPISTKSKQFLQFSVSNNRHSSFSVRASTAAPQATKKDERVKKIHNADEFDEALRAAKNRLVVVEYASRESFNNDRVYPFMVDLSRNCSDVDFLLILGDESEDTRSLCKRERVNKAPHFTFYKSMEKIHEEEGISPDQFVGDVLYYGDNHSAVVQLHNREDVEKLIGEHKADGKLLVLDVGLKHCGPCVKVYPTVLKLSRSMADTVVFARMNGDENDSCMQFLKDMNVVEVPTFLFIRDGDICGRYVGSGKGELIGEILRYQGVRVTY